MEKAVDLVKKQDPFHKNIGKYSNILGTERQISLKRKVQLAPIQRHPMASSNVINEDYVPITDERHQT